MGREIKFRAWVFDEGNPEVMVYGDDKKSELTLISNGEGFSVLDSDRESWIDEKYFAIMQFTGLKDKNGKDIYEGDILAEANRKDFDKINFVGYEVFYHDNDSCEFNVGFQMNRHHFYGSIAGTQDFRKFIPKTVLKMEIIGNIYQHPELLKQLEK